MIFLVRIGICFFSAIVAAAKVEARLKFFRPFAPLFERVEEKFAVGSQLGLKTLLEWRQTRQEVVAKILWLSRLV